MRDELVLVRRRFAALVAALGFGSSLRIWADEQSGGGGGPAAEPEALRLSRNGWMPNNEHLPILLYRHAVDARGSDPAAHFEQLFERKRLAAAMAQRRVRLSPLPFHRA